jgi:hypothetical protein
VTRAGRRLGEVALVAIGLVFAGYGALCLVAPGWAGLDLPTARAAADVRATYGGLGIGVGAFLLYAARRPALLGAALLAAFLACAGIAAGRLAGVAFDGARDPITLAELAVELSGVALAGAALRARRG